MAYTRYSRGRSRKGGGRGGRSFRRAVWVRDWKQSATVPVSGTGEHNVVLDLLPDTAIDDGARLGSTVTRIRGQIRLQMLSATGFPDQPFFFGVTVAPTSAQPLASGSRNDFQWLTWGEISLGSAAQILVQNQTVIWGYEFDVKSQRIITQPAESLLMSINYKPLTAVVGGWQDYRVSTSVLLKLA